MAKTIGEYFRNARVGAYMDVDSVVSQTGLIEIEQLRALEADTYRPPLDTLFALVNCYNLNPDEFLELLYSLAIGKETVASSVDRQKAVESK